MRDIITELADRPADELDADERKIGDLYASFMDTETIQAKGLQPIEARPIKEKRATLAITPGIDALRPSAQATHAGGIENLMLAGDWCDTGWPATMEGAVRSGVTAAQAVLADLSTAALTAAEEVVA